MIAEFTWRQNGLPLTFEQVEIDLNTYFKLEHTGCGCAENDKCEPISEDNLLIIVTDEDGNRAKCTISLGERTWEELA